MRATIYARVSLREGQETENQLRQLREFLESNQWEAAGEYIDRESGRSSDRPEFLRLFEDARRRRFDLVLFWSLDRFSREGVLATLEHLERLTKAGVGWRSFTEQYLDSTGVFRDAVISILATVAKQERIRIGERTKAGMDRARAQGKQIGRPRRVVDAEQLRRLLGQMTLAEVSARTGVSCSTIRRRLR